MIKTLNECHPNIFQQKEQDKVTLVSIHVRIQDYEQRFEGKHYGYLQWAGNLGPVPDKYFTEAMEYFYKKYNVSHKINDHCKCSPIIFIIYLTILPMF